MPYLDPSRPSPDAFTPPNGTTSVEISPSLKRRVPERRARYRLFHDIGHWLDSSVFERHHETHHAAVVEAVEAFIDLLERDDAAHQAVHG